MTSTVVWQRPSRAVRRWALAAVVLMLVTIGLAAGAIAWDTTASNAYSAAAEREQIAYDASQEAVGTADEEAAQAELADAQEEFAQAGSDLERSGTVFPALLWAATVAGGLAIATAVVALVLRVRAAAPERSHLTTIVETGGPPRAAG